MQSGEAQEEHTDTGGIARKSRWKSGGLSKINRPYG